MLAHPSILAVVVSTCDDRILYWSRWS